jgi:hypothetical protein
LRGRTVFLVGVGKNGSQTGPLSPQFSPVRPIQAPVDPLNSSSGSATPIFIRTQRSLNGKALFVKKSDRNSQGLSFFPRLNW